MKKLRARKKHKNVYEEKLQEKLVDSIPPWTVFKRGWPDFLCYRKGKFMVVEAKKTKEQQLKVPQLIAMIALRLAGVDCRCYDPEEGLKFLSLRSLIMMAERRLKDRKYWKKNFLKKYQKKALIGILNETKKRIK
jgi:hypothetical protein